MNIIKRGFAILLISLLAFWLVVYINVNYVNHEYAPVSRAQLATAKKYLGKQITPVPDSFEWRMFESEPGVFLRTGILEHPNPKGTVVVVPGFTGAIEMVMREITMIHAAGYRVASIEYRGQGLSYRPLGHHPEKGYVEDYKVLGAELAAFAKETKQADSPLFFFSISKGAHITMRMAAEQTVDVQAFALIVPMIKINSGEVAYDDLRNVAAGMTHVGLGAAYAPGGSAWPGEKMVFGEATGCNANPDTAQAQSALFAINEKLRTKSVTYKWLYETTNSSDKLLSQEFVKPIDQAVKIYTAGIDELVSTDAANSFCDSLLNCESKHYSNSRHCITREDYALYDGIINDAIAHFDQNSG